MTPNIRAALVIITGWIAVFAAVSFFRPLMPVIELRYMTVAWEMMLQQHWILPTLNFLPYGEKPPLLFWLIHLSWEIFGVGVLGPRIFIFAGVGALFYATARLTRYLWPENADLPWRAALLLSALPLMLIFSSTIMFDALLALCVVITMMTLWQAAQNKRHAFIWFGFAIGLGVLIKGPVILTHVLPAALLAPLWSTQTNWKRWYASVAYAVVIGAAMGLAWAIPASLQAGPDYMHRIFVTQSAGRMVDAFDHVEPFWFYGPVLLGFLLPFLTWPALWGKTAFTPQTRFLLCWILPTLIFFSAISSKSIHYLMPMMPGIAILAALMARESRWRFGGIPIVITALPSAVMLAWPDVATTYILGFYPLVATIHIGICEAMAVWVWRRPQHVFHALALSSFLLVVVAHVQLGVAFLPRYDLSGLKATIAPYMNGKIATAPGYDGEYGYVLGLRKPIDPVKREYLDSWFINNRDGVAITRFKTPYDTHDDAVLYKQDYRREHMIMLLKPSYLCYPEHVPYYKNFLDQKY